jgi:heme-degrading monooxygenase HmoA
MKPGRFGPCSSGCCPLSAFRSLHGISEDIEALTYASFIQVNRLILAILAWKGQQPDKHVFRVRIDTDLRQEFEEKLFSISVHAVNEAAGFISVSIHKPTKWAPDEYAMISQWENELSLKAFAGEEWCRAVIPHGMEKFVVESWVHHFESWVQA